MKAAPPRAETSSLVAVASGASRDRVCETLEILAGTSGVKPMLITLGTDPEPRRADRNGIGSAQVRLRVSGSTSSTSTAP